jgi:hypothetical protein
MSRPRKDMYLVPCRAQNEKLAKFDGGEYAECKCNLSIQKQKSEIGQQSYYWKNLIKSSSFQRLKSVWKCRPKQSLQTEGEWEFFLQTPNKDHFKCSSQDVPTTAILFSLRGIEMHIEKDTVLSQQVCLFVCLIVFFLEAFLEFRTWTTTHLQIQVQLAASAAGRNRSTDRSSTPLHESNSASKRWFQQNVDRLLQRSVFHQITSLF